MIKNHTLLANFCPSPVYMTMGHVCGYRGFVSGATPRELQKNVITP